ncbi:hypothetical protein [Streptomyces atratus]|uniref:hypothetical protein n=1 Tax=Streptomyces atratus TaxID=1893 RepID=UPI0037A9D140
MTTTALYEIETSEADDGTTQPAEQLWTPCADDAADNGFIAHQGLFVTGIDDPTDDHRRAGRRNRSARSATRAANPGCGQAC